MGVGENVNPEMASVLNKNNNNFYFLIIKDSDIV